jgi:hypothetical protein
MAALSAEKSLVNLGVYFCVMLIVMLNALIGL